MRCRSAAWPATPSFANGCAPIRSCRSTGRFREVEEARSRTSPGPTCPFARGSRSAQRGPGPARRVAGGEGVLASLLDHVERRVGGFGQGDEDGAAVAAVDRARAVAFARGVLGQEDAAALGPTRLGV